MIRTQGADGEYRNFEVSHTFGVYPLQQYLIPFAGGRMQSFTVAWDARPASEGGQRWFHLYPDEKIAFDDELHWTGINQNWNYMCGECHSTAFEKRYDPDSKSYASHWTEVNVSCEACHGPASGHVEWAANPLPTENAGLVFALSESRQWLFTENDVTAKRIVAAGQANDRAEIDTCAVCHSRATKIDEPHQQGQSVHDSHAVSLLRDNLYFADGQIDDEVYVYGSFLQSKMYQQGVTCSDCHNPHTLELKAEGDGTCLQCHSASEFAVKEHHKHSPQSDGARCASCHMPEKTYMVVDPRRDHSFRIPRPDLSDSLGTPNACIQCHDDRSNQWASGKIADWYLEPKTGYQKYSQVLFAARTQSRSAVPALQQLILDNGQPAIARATAVSHLGIWLDQQTLNTVDQALRADSPMVRSAALAALEGAPGEVRWPRAIALAVDPIRNVRNEAGRLLADLPDDQITAGRADTVSKARQDYIDTQMLNADRAEAQTNLGSFYSASGNQVLAETAYKEALRLNMNFTPAYVGLANLYANSGRQPEAEQILESGISQVADNASLYHALGLQWVRQQRTEDALMMLGKAAAAAPEVARYSFVYAVALHDLGDPEQSIVILEHALTRHTGDAQIISALYNYSVELGRVEDAERYRKMLQ
jgi:Flp pilus assembly protein TadD